MDLFSGVLPSVVIALFGGGLWFGVSAVVHFRRGRRERLQMKKHLRQIGLAGFESS